MNIKYFSIEIMWISNHAKIEKNEYINIKAKKIMKDFILNQVYNYKSLKSTRIKYIKVIIKR